MQMNNVNGIQLCCTAIYGTNQLRMTLSFTFGGGFGSQPNRPNSDLGKPGSKLPRLESGFNIWAVAWVFDADRVVKSGSRRTGSWMTEWETWMTETWMTESETWMTESQMRMTGSWMTGSWMTESGTRSRETITLNTRNGTKSAYDESDSTITRT